MRWHTGKFRSDTGRRSGNCIGNALGYGQSVTTGIVSAKDRTMDSYDGKLLQTDAAINPETAEVLF